MKILIATGIFEPEIGGPACYISSLAEEFVKKGHHPCVITYSDRIYYDLDRELIFPVIRIKRKNKLLNYIFYFLAVWREAKFCDIVYAFDYFSAGLPALFAAKLRGIKMVMRNGGDLIWERYLDQHKDGITLRDFYKSGLYRVRLVRFLIAKWVLKYTDMLIFSTHLQGEIFEKYYEIKPSKIRYINNPLPNKNHANIEGVIAKDIIWAGRMINKNNVLRLIRVFCDLDQEDFNLVLIGEGELRRSLQDYSNKFGRDKVQVKDKVGRDELRKIISQSYAAIFPAYTDISPNTVLDCLVADTPFIITKEHGYDWLRRRLPEFDPTDDGAIKNALLKLIQPGCRNRLVNDMVSITYSYDFERAANDTIKIFEELTM